MFGVELLFDVFGDAIAAVIENLHAETLRAAGHGLTNSAEADNAESFSPDISAAVLIKVPALPVPCPHILIGFNDAACDGEHQSPGEIGGGFIKDAGSVGDEDAAAGARRNVHIVVANGDVGDNAQLGSGAKTVVANAFSEQADQAFLVFEAAEKFVFGGALLLRPELAVADGLKESLCFGIKRMGDENFGFRHVGSALSCQAL